MIKLNKKYLVALIFFLIGFGFIGGFFAGMIYQQTILFLGLANALQSLEGNSFNLEIDINETLMTDRVTENMKPILWDIRMQNCTKTEKGYCAIECYENGYLMPCENFTNTEAFCYNGKCEVNGVCPTYYESLRGDTIQDCIKELEK